MLFRSIKASAEVVSLITRGVVRGERFYWIGYGDREKVFESEVIVNGFADPQDSDIIKGIDDYPNAVDDYGTVEESFSLEPYVDRAAKTFGEEALYQKITLAWDTQQKATVVELCNEFKSSYPDSNKNIKKYCDTDYKLSNQEISVTYVTINGEPKKITFDGIYEPGVKDYSATIFVDNAGKHNGEKILRKNGKSYISDNESIVLKKLEDDYAVFDVSGIDYGIIKELTYDPKNLKIELDDYKIVGKNKYKISLEKINLKKSAKVSLSPGFKDTGTEASFGFKVGIEKRTFKLSPDKIKEQIKSLDSELGKWQNFSEGLGKVVKGLKTACLATGAGLVFKNFLANTGGAGIARKFVMRGAGGWYGKCADLVSDGTYISQEQCLVQKADNIDKDVDKLTNLIEEQNKEIQDLEKKNMGEGFGNKAVNTDDFVKDYVPKVRNCLKNLPQDSFTNPNDDSGEKINKANILTILSLDYKERKYSIEQLKNIELFCKSIKNAGLKELSEKELYSTLLDVKTNAGEFVKISSWASELGANPGDIPFIEIGDNVEKYIYKGWTYGNLKTNLPRMSKDTPLGIAYDSTGRKYILVLDDSAGKIGRAHV